MRSAVIVALATLVACGNKDSGPADDGNQGTPDPAVNSYLPPDYVPTAPTRVVFMGDSITSGGGASSSAMKYATLVEKNNSSAWPDHDEVDLESSFPSITEVLDVSEFGATSDSMIANQLDAAEAAIGGFPASGETIVLVTIGGNDAQQAILGADVDTLMANGLANVETMLDWAADPNKFPDGVFIYATNIYEPTGGQGTAGTCFFGLDLSNVLGELPPFNDTLRQMGKDRGVAVVDLYGHFNAHGHNADASEIWFAPDCIHPNDRGHHEIRRLFHAAVTGHPLYLEE